MFMTFYKSELIISFILHIDLVSYFLYTDIIVSFTSCWEVSHFLHLWILFLMFVKFSYLSSSSSSLSWNR